jgi:hypothetical protein
MKPKHNTRVSDYFRLKKTQAELDFVDVPTFGDVRLFIDPYSFTLDEDPWVVECNNLVVDYFSLLIETIRSGNDDDALRMLGNLHEPEDTHLGFAQAGSSGRGIGRDQARELFVVLKNSKAVRTGALADLSDCELMIPGVSSDKISDITTNIVRGMLLDYTEAQCNLHSIPTYNVQGGVHWNSVRRGWVNRYANVPVIDGRRLILVPKACVRFRPAITADEFYKDYVLDYLEAEHLSANSSLVHTLKNGKKKVYRKDLREKYPATKEFLFQFSQEHPNILREYKQRASLTSHPLQDQDLEMAHTEGRLIDYQKIATDTLAIPPGRENAADFHSHICGALQAIFYPALRYPKKEEDIHNGRKRVDITFNNGAANGFFDDLRKNYRVHCPFVFFECKNYKSDVANPELDQLTGRFSDKRGQFGVIVCRHIDDKAKMQERCRDVLKDNRGWIFVIDDDDIASLLKLRAEGNLSEINRIMNQKMRDLVM